MQPGLIIVSNRLPVSVKKTDGKLEFYQSVGGLSMGLASYVTDRRNKWIGWPGLASDDLTESDRQEISKRLLKDNCYPVFLTQKQIDGFYNGYSNRLLWPLFHDVPLSKSALVSEDGYWKVYRQVNEVYAETVLALSDSGSNIWVHDYQLLLLPALLRVERPEDKIGFFLHIPFPEAKGFSVLKNGTTLLAGMLGADLVGFHIVPYADNFLDTVRQFDLGVIQPHKVLLGNRVVRVTDFPIGIDYAKWRRANKLWRVRRKYTQLKLKYWHKKIILTVDRLDPTKGFIERITAYRSLLEQNPSLRGKVKLVMIAVPSRTDIQEYKKLRKDVEQLVKDINREFGTTRWLPVEYNYTSLPFEELRALYQRADIALVTPLRDGMNLVAKEYVASKSRNRGVLVLSKTAGAAQELKDAIMVDPLEPASLVRGLKRAVLMPKRKFKKRVAKMQSILADSTIQTWAVGFMKSLKQNTPGTQSYTATLTKAKQSNLVSEFNSAFKRLFLLDYDGVLAAYYAKPEEAKPSAQLRRILKQLGSETDSKVVIISGRDREIMTKWLGDLPVELVAEHGNFTKTSTSKTWQTTPNNSVKDWQNILKPVLEKYAKKAPGAFVETKAAALVWHYRKASPYNAQKYLVILKRILKPLAKKYGLEVIAGKKILEIRPLGINKGISAFAWYDRMQPDFVLCIGDDYTDEDMFTHLPADSHTVKVGRGRTAARYRLKNSSEVLRFLEKLSKK